MLYRATAVYRLASCVSAALLLAEAGCTHTQVQTNTLHEAEVIHQTQQQQVLDNLAMFARDPNAVPYFTDISSGATSVTDTGTASISPSWTKAGFASVGAAFMGSRLNQEGLSLAPVTDPYRLHWMRIAYQASLGIMPEQEDWTEFSKLVAAWDKTWPSGCPCSRCSFSPVVCPSAEPYLPQPGWFCCGKHGDVPKHALYVGHYQDCYVWVPDGHTGELAQLTLIVLGIAATHRQVSWERNCDCSQFTCPPFPPAKAGDKPALDKLTPPPTPPGGANAPPVPCKCTEITTIGEASSTSSSGGGGAATSKALAVPSLLPSIVVPQ